MCYYSSLMPSDIALEFCIIYALLILKSLEFIFIDKSLITIFTLRITSLKIKDKHDVN